MKIIKKIDIYLLRNFLGLFLATFFIAIFILLMQFMWMHVNDLVGKGISISVLAEFFLYATASVVPLALPLAILLSSLISFGNLAEKFELTAMKAAGISLFRIMRPLVLAVALLSVGAFFFSNNVLPKSQTKLWALIFSLRQKSPALDIPVGEFYDEISGYHIYVRDKTPQGDLINIMIYDYSCGFENAKVMVADTGRMVTSAHIDECIVGYADYACTRVTVDATEGTDLTHIDVAQTGQLKERTVCCIVNTFLVTHEASVEAPCAFPWVYRAAAQQHLQLVFFKAEDDAVHRYKDFLMF